MRCFHLVYWAIFLCFFFASESSFARWGFQQLTNNSYHDKTPVLTDTLIGWVGRPAGNDEIFIYDGQNTTQLTNNSVTEQDLSGSSGYLAWIDRANPDNVFVYNGTSVLQITNSGINYRPRISGEYLVYGKTTNDVMLYNLASYPTSPVQLLAPPAQGGMGNELDPWIFGDWVSFTSNEGDSEIYYYQISTGTTTKLTNDGLSDYESVINDGFIGYIHYDGNDREVMLYDRTLVQTDQLTDDTESCGNLFLNGNYFGYITGSSPIESTLHLYDTVNKTTATIATNVSVYASDRPSSHGDYIVYKGWDGNDMEIYAYQISTQTTFKVTNNSLDDQNPQVRNGTIVWEQLDAPQPDTGDYEIMMATYSPGGTGLFFPVRAKNDDMIIINLP